MLGGIFALLAAVCFGLTNASVRRGVLSGSALQATGLSIPAGVPVFFVALLLSGDVGAIATLPRRAMLAFAAAGINHFLIGRYLNYRAITAIGTNLAGPVAQFNVVVSLALAILWLGETLTPLRILGILCIFAGPLIIARDRAPRRTVAFTPRLAEGYVFAFFSAVSYGITPVLVRYGGAGRGLPAALGGGVIGSCAACVVLAVLLLRPGRWRELTAIDRRALPWFAFSGVMVYVSQVFIYMGLAVAPVNIVSPILGLQNVMRMYFSRWLNPSHEVFGRAVAIATALAFLGALLLSLEVDTLPLPSAWVAALSQHWP